MATVYEQAMRLGPLLWTRRPEHWNFLALRLGVGRAREPQHDPGVVSDRDAASPGTPGRSTSCARGTSRSTTCRSSSCCRARARIGIAGSAPPRRRRRCAASACSCSGCTPRTSSSPPRSWIPPGRGELEWMKWLPHTTSPRNPVRRARAGRQPVGRHGAAQRARGGDPRAPVGHPEPPWAAARRPTPRWRSAPGWATRSTPPRHGSTATSRSCSSPRTTRPSTGRASRRSSSAAPTPASTRSSSRPTVESLPAACRTFVDATEGLDAATRRLRPRRASEYDAGARRGRLEPVRRGVRQAARPGRRLELGRGRLERPPAQRVAAGAPRHRRRRAPASVVERWRQNNSILDRSARPAAPAEARRDAEGVHRPGQPRRDVARPPHAGPARPRRRHDRLGQVRVPPGLGARHGRGVQPRSGHVPLRRLQGRVGVRRLRRAAALRRPRDRPQPAPRAARADEPARRAAPPRAPLQPQEGEGPPRAREAPATPRPRRPSCSSSTSSRRSRARCPSSSTASSTSPSAAGRSAST